MPAGAQPGLREDLATHCPKAVVSVAAPKSWSRKEGPRVRRLPAGASRIRTLGPTPSLAGRQTARTRLIFPPSKFIAPVEALAAVSVLQSSNAATLVSSAPPRGLAVRRHFE